MTREEITRGPARRSRFAGPSRADRGRPHRSDPPRVVLKGSRPSELMAYACHCYGAVPRDGVVLIGVTDEPLVAGAARIPDDPRMEDEDRTRLIDEVALAMAGQGCVELIVLAVGSDPYADPDECDADGPLLSDAGRLLRWCVLTGEVAEARALGTRHWMICDGLAFPVLLDPEEEALDLGEPTALAAPDDSLVAADLVLEGEPLSRLDHPPVRLDPEQLDRVLGRFEAWQGPGPALPDPDAVWAGLASGGRLADRLADPGSRVTACELVADLAVALADVRGRDRLLDLLVEHVAGREIERDTACVAMLEDPTIRPNRNVMPGGDWFDLLDDVHGALSEEELWRRVDRVPTASAALDCVMALLLWWDCRYAACVDRLERVRLADPQYSLAGLISVLVEECRPAWLGERMAS